jgi:DNA-binding protein H-NS
MATNQERRAAIETARAQLKLDLAALEKKYREDSGALEKHCRQQIATLEREIKDAEAEEVRAARLEIQRILVAAGLRADQVLGAPAIKQLKAARKPTAPSTVLHTGPEGQIWRGRGPQPKWFKRQQQGEIGGGHA